MRNCSRGCYGAEFEFVVKAFGFTDVDIEDVIAPRAWRGDLAAADNVQQSNA